MEIEARYDHVGVVIVAAGSSRRMGGGLPKQFRILGGEPVLARTIRTFARALPQASIAVVLPAEQILFWRDLAARFDLPLHVAIAGGEERFHSVKNGIDAIGRDRGLIAVHDGVRPLTTIELIRRTVACAAAHGAAIPAVAPADSLRLVTDGGSEVVDRARMRLVQTPQVFLADWLRAAYELPYDPAFTDDATAVERLGHPVFLCEGERTNLKLTTREDFLFAEALLTSVETPAHGEEGL